MSVSGITMWFKFVVLQRRVGMGIHHFSLEKKVISSRVEGVFEVRQLGVLQLVALSFSNGIHISDLNSHTYNYARYVYRLVTLSTLAYTSAVMQSNNYMCVCVWFVVL